jgi:hypothetical protein
MYIISRKDYPKEIIINLDKIKVNDKRHYDVKCLVAHDYVQFEGHRFIEDKDGKGYYVKTDLQIPIAMMFEFMKLLNKSPNLKKEHMKNKNYFYCNRKGRYEDWHCEKGNMKNIFLKEKKSKKRK